MSKSSTKRVDRTIEREERTRHHFNMQKKEQNKKMMKDLDKALRNKDFRRLATMDDY